MNRNWVCADMRLTSSQKRSVLESSSGASTSSSRQNGAGLSWNIANTSEIAVSAFSPPDSRWMLLFFLPGGCAITCTPASRISSPVMTSFASPPPNSVGNSEPKWLVDAVEGLAQQLARLAVDLADRVLERRHRLVQVGGLRVEEALALAALASSSSAARLTAPSAAIVAGEARDLALQGGRARRVARLRSQQRLRRHRPRAAGVANCS